MENYPTPHKFTVKFQREQGDDTVFAQALNPDKSPMEQLIEQFKHELNADPRYRHVQEYLTNTQFARIVNHDTRVMATYAIMGIRLTGKGMYYIWAEFTFKSQELHDIALQELRTLLQETYDHFGVAGMFNIED